MRATLPPMRRRDPQQARSHETIARIRAAAAELIARSGANALRMSHVAREAGLSQGALYGFFADRDALLASYVAGLSENLDALIATSQPPEDVRGIADWIVAVMSDFYAAHPSLRSLGDDLDALVEAGPGAILNGAIMGHLVRLDPEMLEDDRAEFAWLALHVGDAMLTAEGLPLERRKSLLHDILGDRLGKAVR